MRRSVILAWMFAAVACGGGGAPAPAVPTPPAAPTSFEAATRTWKVVHVIDDVCRIADTAVCGDDCSTDEPANTAPYDCPVEGIAGSDPWHVYRLADGCWLHGNPPICDDDGCAPAVTRGVPCPP